MLVGSSSPSRLLGVADELEHIALRILKEEGLRVHVGKLHRFSLEPKRPQSVTLRPVALRGNLEGQMVEDDPFGPGPEPAPRELLPTDSPRLEPEVGGANFVFVTLPPTSPDAELGWHRTETVDINVLLGGELVLLLDKEETTLHPGDAVIQRNTMHAWKNPTSGPVYWVAVLVRSGSAPDAAPAPRPVIRRRYFASGSGRIWKRTILLVVPFPPSVCQLKFVP